MDGTPALWPLSWVHPTETGTVDVEAQFYFGPSLLVSPVVVENSTSVEVYLPNATFYDFFTLQRVQGQGAKRVIEGVGYETMPLHIRGGSVLPLRSASTSAAVNSTAMANSTRGPMTTGENRDLPFQLIVAPNATAQAEGYLRLDDGVSLNVGEAYSDVYLSFSSGELRISGTFGYDPQAHGEDARGAQVDGIVFAGQNAERKVQVDGKEWGSVYSAENKTITVSGLGKRFGFGAWSVRLV